MGNRITVKVIPHVKKKLNDEVVSMRQIGEKNRKKRTNMKKVEQFIFQTYLNFSTEDSMMILLSSDVGCNVVGYYLKSINDMEYLELYKSCERVLNETISCTDKGSGFKSIFQTYIWPRTVKSPNANSLLSEEVRESCLLTMKMDLFDVNCIDCINKNCVSLLKESVFILYRSYF